MLELRCVIFKNPLFLDIGVVKIKSYISLKIMHFRRVEGHGVA